MYDNNVPRAYVRVRVYSVICCSLYPRVTRAPHRREAEAARHVHANRDETRSHRREIAVTSLWR